MPGFLSNLLERFSDREHVDEQVRHAFQQAMDLDGCVRLLSPDSQEDGGMRTWCAAIVSVNEADILIDTPSDGKDRWQLEQGQTIEVAILSRQGRQCGLAQCTARVAIETGGSKPMPGWRLAYPPSLTVNERRSAHRVQVGFDLAPQAFILDGRSSGPIESQVMDLSIGGLQLRCAPAADRLAQGQTVDLELHLPEPVGSVLVQVKLAAIRCDEQAGHCRIGVSFNGAVDGMAELVRAVEIRRARRRRLETVGS